MSKISTGHAKKLVLNYATQKIGTTITKEETRGVWFSRLAIEEALNTPVNKIMPDGLRIYFAAYEAMAAGKPPKHKEEKSKITLVLIPTKGVDDDGHIVPHPYRNAEIVHFDLVDNPNDPPEYDDKMAVAENDGQLCPPPRTLI